MIARNDMHLIVPRSLHDLFSPIKKIMLLVEETLADIGAADCLKNPEHSGSSPAIASRPKFLVLP